MASTKIIPEFQLVLPVTFARESTPISIASMKGALMEAIGKKVWAIAEGYIPSYSHGPSPQFESHETACILNTGDEIAHIEIMIYFTEREPAGPYKVKIPARRTVHLRFNSLKDPEPIPLGTDFASVLTSDVPVVVQHTRLDSRQSENALMTTIAYAVH
jgi:hypothetical protein